jgi:acetoin utilization protein AcuB
MNHIPAIKAVMTAFPYSIDISAPVSEALAYMDEHDMRHLPVTRNDKLAGMLTQRDIKLFLALAAMDRELDSISVSEIHMDDPYIVDLDTRLDIVLLEMVDRHINSVLVTRHGRLAGVFTTTDACRSFAEHLREQFSPPGGDEAA